jgi:hypothetical protein
MFSGLPVLYKLADLGKSIVMNLEAAMTGPIFGYLLLGLVIAETLEEKSLVVSTYRGWAFDRIATQTKQAGCSVVAVSAR